MTETKAMSAVTKPKTLTPTYIKKLEAGYWHVRFGRNRFVQWPMSRDPLPSDAFGWHPERLADAARAAVEELTND